MTKTYVDFDLHIEYMDEQYTRPEEFRTISQGAEMGQNFSGGLYRARVLNSPAGPATHEFVLPFSDDKLENFILRISQGRRRVRRLKAAEVDVAREFGAALFETLFDGDVERCLRNSIAAIDADIQSLRLRLRLSDAPELVDIPWEYLYDPTNQRFLALSVDTPLVRYLDLSGRITPLTVAPPLNVLVVIASPTDVVELDVEDEWQRLKRAVADLEARGLVQLERLAQPTLDALQQQLRRGEYHIFHFVGHGGFDPSANDGVLMMEDEQGRGRAVSGRTLGTLLHDEKTLRLAVLNACEGGRTAKTDPFAGVGQSLLQQGVPAVIAMQFEVTDDSAIALASSFYGALTDGYPVEAALTEARKTIYARNELEWGTPVLYMRAPDGQIFDVTAAAVDSTHQATEIQVQKENETTKLLLPPGVQLTLATDNEPVTAQPSVSSSDSPKAPATRRWPGSMRQTILLIVGCIVAMVALYNVGGVIGDSGGGTSGKVPPSLTPETVVPTNPPMAIAQGSGAAETATPSPTSSLTPTQTPTPAPTQTWTPDPPTAVPTHTSTATNSPVPPTATTRPPTVEPMATDIPTPVIVSIIADNQRDFGLQAVNGWQYQIEDGRGNVGGLRVFDYLLPYQSTADQPAILCWQTAREDDVRICQNGEIHPGASGRIAYRWQSDRARRVTLQVHAAKIDTACGDNDGIEILIFRTPPPIRIDKFTIMGADTQGKTADYNLLLKARDEIIVMADIKNSPRCDAARLHLKIR